MGGYDSVLTPIEAFEVLHLELPRGPICCSHFDVIGSVGSCINQGKQQLALPAGLATEPSLALGPTQNWLPSGLLSTWLRAAQVYVPSPKSRKAHQASGLLLLLFFF